MRCVISIQTRASSHRLPGKATKEIGGLPIIWQIYRKMLSCKGAAQVCLAVGGHKSELVTEVADAYHMNYIVGSELHFISRHLDVANACGADAIVRITADCLFHSPEVVDYLIACFVYEWPRHDVVANWPERTWSEGVDCEVISASLLARLDRDRSVPREDFMSHVLHNRQHYNVDIVKSAYQDGECHLSVDTPKDLKRAERMIQILGNDTWGYDRTMAAWRATA